MSRFLKTPGQPIDGRRETCGHPPEPEEIRNKPDASCVDSVPAASLSYRGRLTQCFFMRIYRRRLATWSFGLAYLLASTLSGFLHSHPHENALGSASVDRAHHVHEGVVGHLGHDEHSPAAPPHSDDDCAACRFAAQAALASIPAAEPVRSPVVAELRVLAPHFFIEPVFSSRLARAPPLA